MYHNWHQNFAPRYEFTYFIDRVSNFSGNKDVRAHMTKLRNVYKGEEDLFIELNGDQYNLGKDYQNKNIQSNTQHVAS